MSDNPRAVTRSTVVPVVPEQVFALLAAPRLVRAIGIPRRAERALRATLDGLEQRFTVAGDQRVTRTG